MLAHDSGRFSSGLAARLPFFYGWVVVAVAFVTMGIGVNTRTAFSLLFPPILAEFGWERGVTAAAFSFGFIISTLYAPFIGMFMDRWGPRYVIPFGTLLVSAGLFLAPTIRSPWHLYMTLGVFMVGGSILLSYIGHSLFLPLWFVRRRGLAIGIAFSGVGVGSILLFPWLQHLIDHAGWRQACQAMAVLLVVILVPLNALLQRQRPENMGLLPDGDREIPGGVSGKVLPNNIVDPLWATTEWTLPLAMRTRRFWYVFGGFLSGLFAWYAVQVHQTKYLIEIGLQPTQAAYALSLVPFSGIIGQIGIGYLSDRIGREWGWTFSGAGYVICYALLIVMQQHSSPLFLYLMVTSQGMLGYGLASVFGAIPAELFQGKHYGVIFGTLSLASGTGAALGPWVAGTLYDRFGTYIPAFWLAMGCTVLSTILIWCAAPRKVRAVAGQIKHLHKPPTIV